MTIRMINWRSWGNWSVRSIKHLAVSIPRPIKAAIGPLVAAIILIPMAWQLYVHWDEVIAYVAGANVKLLIAALGFAILDLGIFGLAWLAIARRLNIALGFVRDLRAFFFSNFMKRVPGMVWYVMGRTYLYRSGEGGIWMATTGTVLENAFLLLAGIFLALILWPHQLRLSNSWVVASLLVILTITIVFLLFPAALLRFVQLFRDEKDESAIQTVHITGMDIIVWIVLYLLVWLIGGLSFYCFVSAFDASISRASLLFVLGVSTLYSLTGFVAFFVPGGMGAKELAGALLLRNIIAPHLGLTVMLLFRLNLLVAEGIWLALSALLERAVHRPSLKL